MKILNIPKKFQPIYKSKYPPYSNGNHMEEVFYNFFIKNKDNIKTDYIYIPIFWTSFYILRKYGTQITDLLDFLDKLDKTKKYFTIVQYASGIFVKNTNINITVFSAGGGGINIKKFTEKKVKMNNNPNRVIFIGNKGNFDLPLLCQPLIKSENYKKDILCSFMGRFDTHPCRFDMEYIKSKDIIISSPNNFTNYKKILQKSIFALCPRGYGYTSFRLFEAMFMECIPIYIWEDKIVLPFSDEIKWKEFCIIIHSKDIKKIPQIIKNITSKNRNIMLNKIKEYNIKYFNFEKSFEYIKNKLKN